MPIPIKSPFWVKTPKGLSFLSIALCVMVSTLYPHHALSRGGNPYLSNQSCAPPNYALPDKTKISRIVVKFHEGSGVRFGSAGWKTVEPDEAELSGSVLPLEDSLLSRELNRLNQKNRKGNYRIQPLFNAEQAERVVALKLNGEKRSGRALEDLRLYYELIFDNKSVTYKDVTQMLVYLNRFKLVEIAYAEPVYVPKKLLSADMATLIPTPNPFFTPTPNFEEMQTYLDSPPLGIGARECAWEVPGGRGSQVKIVDVEAGWNTNHEDLPTLFYTYGKGTVLFEGHGTAVLGVIAAVDNNFGVTGIISNAKVGYASVCAPKAGVYCFPEDEAFRNLKIANAIFEATNAVGEGGIVLIELHFPGPLSNSPCCDWPILKDYCGYIPVEYWQLNFDAIQYATANGVTVVEAGGDGSANLDDPVYHGCFDRQVRDSGAILVAASYPVPGIPACYTNWGSRIDVHAWGNNVTTIGFIGDLFKGGVKNQNRYYTAIFLGTSSSSPIVVGAVGSAQGVAMTHWGQPLKPLQLRELLVKTGTPQQPSEKKIGPFPNLCHLIPLVKTGQFD
ncbi:MAG: peptidase S8 [Candidatus Parabeggiatoa sp. nov. 1]|nr:MAG: peptidase S8 [Gammaproteobacteria bacterium]